MDYRFNVSPTKTYNGNKTKGNTLDQSAGEQQCHLMEAIRPNSEPDLPLAVIRGCDWLGTIISPNRSQV